MRQTQLIKSYRNVSRGQAERKITCTTICGCARKLVASYIFLKACDTLVKAGLQFTLGLFRLV